MVRCIRVPKREGEQVRSALFEQGMLDLGSRIRSEDGFLLIPVLCDSYMDYEVVDAEGASPVVVRCRRGCRDDQAP